MKRVFVSSFAIPAMFFAVVLTVEALGRDDHDGPLVVTRLTLVTSRTIDRHIVEDVYRAEVRHMGAAGSTDYAGVRARLEHPAFLSHPGPFQIVDGDLDFGNVRIGQTKDSLDTFTIRRLRHFPLDVQHLRWNVSGRTDAILPETWAGKWRFTITSRDSATQAIVAVDEITDFIAADEALGFSRLQDFVRCTWSSSDHGLEGTCTSRAKVGGCLIEGSAHAVLEQEDEMLEGTLEWQGTASGACGLNAGTSGESIDIAAVRLDDPADHASSSSVLLTRLVSHPGAALLLNEQVKGVLP